MDSTGKALDRLIASARAVLAWEALWRAASTLAGVAAVFLALSWFGLWTALPPAARPFGVIAFAIVALALLARESRRASVGRKDALRRIDRDAGSGHGIASTLTDKPANASDPAAMALWRVHQSRMAARLRTVRLAAPSPRAVDRDSWALRAASVLLALVAAVYAGGDRNARLASAFAWSSDSGIGPSARIDAWIDPPPYTGKPPLVLVGGNLSEARRQASAPVGSTIVVRSAGDQPIEAAVEGGLAQAQEKADAPRRDEREIRFALKGDGRLKLGGGTFEIAAIPDRPPTLELLEQPRANLRGSLGVAYRTGDDYGVASLEARISDPEIQGRSSTTSRWSTPR